MKKVKILKSFRLDPDHVEALRRAGIPIARIVQNAIESVIHKSKCPVCNQEIPELMKLDPSKPVLP